MKTPRFFVAEVHGVVSCHANPWCICLPGFRKVGELGGAKVFDGDGNCCLVYFWVEMVF